MGVILKANTPAVASLNLTRAVDALGNELTFDLSAGGGTPGGGGGGGGGTSASLAAFLALPGLAYYLDPDDIVGASTPETMTWAERKTSAPITFIDPANMLLGAVGARRVYTSPTEHTPENSQPCFEFTLPSGDDALGLSGAPFSLITLYKRGRELYRFYNLARDTSYGNRNTGDSSPYQTTGSPAHSNVMLGGYCCDVNKTITQLGGDPAAININWQGYGDFWAVEDLLFGTTPERLYGDTNGGYRTRVPGNQGVRHIRLNPKRGHFPIIGATAIFRSNIFDDPTTLTAAINFFKAKYGIA